MAFKFETLVKIAGCFALFAGLNVAAADSSKDKNDGISLDVLTYCDKNPDSDSCSKYFKSQGGAHEPCQKALDDFDDSASKFDDACGSVNAKDCVEEIKKCDAGEKRKGDSTDPDDTSNKVSMKDAYAKCPMKAGEGKDDYEKRMDEQQKRTEALQDKYDELEQKAVDKKNATSEKLTQLKDQAAEEAKTHSHDLQQATQSQQAAEKQIMDQVYKLQQNISDAQDALGQKDVEMKEASVKLNATKAQIRLNCHASAMTQVQALQDRVLEKEAGNTYIRGGQHAMLKNVGISDRQQWQSIAKKYYNWCMASQPTIESINGANDVYSLAVLQSNKSKGSIRTKIQQMQDSQTRLVNNTACGPTPMQMNGSSVGGETALCTAAKQAQQQMQQLQTDYNNKVMQMNDKYNTIMKQGDDEYQTIGKQAQAKKQELDKEKNRLTEMEKQFALKDEVSGGINTDAKDVDKAFSMFAAMKSKAHALESHSCDSFCKDGSCNEAKDFYSKVTGYQAPEQAQLNKLPAPDQESLPDAPANDSRTPAQSAADKGNQTDQDAGKGAK